MLLLHLQKVLLPEIEVTAAQLSDGITVLLTRNDDNTYTQTIYTNPADVPMLLATADGVIDWAEFHLGFKDWTNYSNELYFNVSSDEPLDKIPLLTPPLKSLRQSTPT